MKKFIKGFFRWLKMFPRCVFAGYSQKKHLTEIETVMGSYDMVNSPSEDYFRDRYLEIINEIIKQNFKQGFSLRVLDAGCGQGRIAIELAKMGHIIDAMDYVEATIEKGKKYAEQMHVSTFINWRIGKIPEDLSFYKDEAYDMVLCLEVLYMMSYKECLISLQKLSKKVKKGGVLMISVRPRFYYLAYSLINRDFLRLQHAARNMDFSELGQ
ncbi:MAG: class I SAM-dependent methyltransferase, partial [Candidatus Ratteibacteria bacterium]